MNHSLDLLAKARKDDLAALGEHADWAKNTLTYQEGQQRKEHGAHLNWLAQAVKKQGGSLAPEHKTAIEHYASMYHLPEVRNAKLQGKDLQAGLHELSNAEKAAMAKMPKKGIVTQKGMKVADTKTGKSWWNLGVAGCEEEGKAGAHCGNAPALKNPDRQHERVISLRSPTNTPGKMQQHLTFINNNGYITEAKGKGNTKPHDSYHSDILDLLEHPSIKGFVGGGFLPGSNFEPEDVKDPALKARLENLERTKPGFFSPDVSDLHSSIQKDPFLSLSVTKKGQNDSELYHGKELSYEEQAKFASDEDSDVRWGLAQNPNLHPDHQAKLANDQELHVRSPLAQNPNLHPDHQAKLANDQHLNVRSNLAQNPNLHPDLQAKLANDQHPGVREGLARNPNVHPDLQTKLANDQSTGVKSSLARNPNVHPDLQTKLANDQSTGVKSGLANNPNLHSDLQAKLANDQHPNVRRDLARNPNLHPDHQAKLANDQRPDVRWNLAKNPNLHPDLQAKLANDQDPYVRRDLAQNPNLHPDHQVKLDNDQDPYVRRNLAKNPNLHPDHQAKLANDQDSDVRRSLANNPNLHSDLQAKLANDQHPNVRRDLARNPNLHPALAEPIEASLIKTIRDAQIIDENGNPQPAYEGAEDDQQEAAESLQILRKNKLINQFKDPATDIAMIKRYEFSHNEEVAKAAQKALAERSNTQDSMKKSDNKPAWVKTNPSGGLSMVSEPATRAAEGYEDHHPKIHDGINMDDVHKEFDQNEDGVVSLGTKVVGHSKLPFKVVVKPAQSEELNDTWSDMVMSPGGHSHLHFFSPDFTTAHREALYAKLAHKFFGMGKYVPPTTAFWHDGQLHSGQLYVNNAHPFVDFRQAAEDEGMSREDIFESVAPQEDRHKLAIMNKILGNHDRHQGNALVDGKGQLQLIDHGLAFDYGHGGSVGRYPIPGYIDRVEGEHTKPLNGNAIKWTMGLNPVHLENHMIASKADPEIVKTAVNRLKQVQKDFNAKNAAGEAPTMNDVHNSVSVHGLNDNLKYQDLMEEYETTKRKTRALDQYAKIKKE